MKNKYMSLALKEAQKAYDIGEVPIGCVIVLNDKVIAKAHNMRITKNNALAHAEILAINKACKKIGSWRLDDASIYVTLEPCIMCAGAITQARIANLYFALKEPKGGACGSYIDAFSESKLNKVYIESGIMEEESKALMQSFFKKLRVK